MITMNDFKKIIQARNAGKSQKEIAIELGISERTVRSYLKSGKIPTYQRQSPTKLDPVKPELLELARGVLNQYPRTRLRSIYKRLQEAGYVGSYRTLCRRLEPIRRALKPMPVYFQREHLPGDVMEGDFTELAAVPIGGKKVSVQLWVVRLLFGGRIMATAFYNTTWECFLEGSVRAFESFGGLATRYRLDNLSPVVKLLHRQRRLSARFVQFQNHYGFQVDFCNPASGWEKGSIESTIHHLKAELREAIALGNLQFKDMASFGAFVRATVDRFNNQAEVLSRFPQEGLRPLPLEAFPAYESVPVRIDKFSTFSPLKDGHRYSAPSALVGLCLEARVYSCRVELVDGNRIVASHPRLRAPARQTRIHVVHLIGELCKKPGVVSEWKHRHLLFENPVWNRFYERLKANPTTSSIAIQEYLKSLKHVVEFGTESVTAAMERCLEAQTEVSANQLKEVLSNPETHPILEIQPVRRNLIQYDALFNFKSKEKTQ